MISLSFVEDQPLIFTVWLRLRGLICKSSFIRRPAQQKSDSATQYGTDRQTRTLVTTTIYPLLIMKWLTFLLLRKFQTQFARSSSRNRVAAAAVAFVVVVVGDWLVMENKSTWPAWKRPSTSIQIHCVRSAWERKRRARAYESQVIILGS